MALVSANVTKVMKLLWHSRFKWYNLGLELGIDEPTLKVIQKDNKSTDACFSEMLSCLLKMIDPLPSWEAIVKALCQPSVNCKKVASDVAKKCNVPLPGKYTDSEVVCQGAWYIDKGTG